MLTYINIGSLVGFGLGLKPTPALHAETICIMKIHTKIRKRINVEVPEVLNDVETQKILLSMMEGCDEKGATEEEMQIVYLWCWNARFHNIMLDTVLSGHVVIAGVRDGEPVFIGKDALEKRKERDSRG